MNLPMFVAPIYTTGILAIAASSSFAQYPTLLHGVEIEKDYQIDAKAPELWNLGASNLSCVEPTQQEILTKFAASLIENIEDIDSEIYQLVEEHFWELT